MQKDINMKSSIYVPAPQSKTTPVTGLQLVNRENKGALVVDQQNVVWQFKKLGFPRIDPRWYLNLAHRVTNLERAVAVCNLQAPDPILNRPFIATAWLWAEYGFQIIHVPARRIRSNDQTADSPSSEDLLNTENSEIMFHYKDMTDIGVRDEIRHLSGYPNMTHIILASHDVDYASDMRQSSWGKSKKTTLLKAGDGYISQNLQGSADDTANVLDYTGCYSARALDKRQWWLDAEDVEQRRQKIERWFNGNGIYPKYLENQFSDMQRLFHHLSHELKLIPPDVSPSARRLSFGKLKLAIHKLWREEKIMAELPVVMVPEDRVHPASIEAYEPTFPIAQSKALELCLTEMLNIFIRNNVLKYVYDGAISTKLFYLNFTHPAVQAILETGFG